jgi:hypothetical protein
MSKLPFVNLSRILVGAALAGAIAAFVGCTFTQDLEPYESDRCPENFKPCEVQGEMQCVSIDNPLYGCGVTGVCQSCYQVVLHAEPTCGPTRQCSFAACETIYRSCDLNDANGCETDTSKTAEHCGACGNKCEVQAGTHVAAANCVAGKCERKCEDGWSNCNLIISATDGCECELSKNTCVGTTCTPKP